MPRKNVAAKKEVSGKKECACQTYQAMAPFILATIVLFVAIVSSFYAAGLAIIFFVVYGVCNWLMMKGEWPCKKCE